MHEITREQFEQLSARLSSLEAEREHFQQDNNRLRQENLLLRQKLDQWIRQYLGGGRSESLDKHQLELLLQGMSAQVVLEQTAKAKAPANKQPTAKRQPARRVLAEDKLQTQEIVLEPAEVQAQPEGWRKISEERTTLLEWEPGKLFRRVIVRPRYVREEQFALAALPPQPIPQGMVGPGLLAQVFVNKFQYHLPLFRQEKMFKEQYGIELSRKTMGSWVEQGAELLKPVYRAMRQDLIEGSYLQADETPIRYLDPDLAGQSQKGYLWAYARPGADVIFEWQTNREAEGPRQFLKDFVGKLQTDGYIVYESLAKEREGLLLVGCWAHTRRNFVNALEENKLAAWFVLQIGLLYRVEKGLRQIRAGPALRSAMRIWQSGPVLRRLRAGMELVQQRVLPKSALGQAINYALKRWEALTRYMEDGALEIDTNLLENAIRPSALGKKNWLFIGHPEAGERSAVIYSLLGSCQRHGLNSYEYLKDLFTRLPAAKITEINNFTPAAWAKARTKTTPAQNAA